MDAKNDIDIRYHNYLESHHTHTAMCSAALCVLSLIPCAAARLATHIVHYNVLAEQYGSNLQPWFLYGAQVTEDEREHLTAAFYNRNEDGQYSKWPSWADGVLSPERQQMAEETDARLFKWDLRRERLWSVLAGSAADVLTLAECDCYDDFWQERLESAGYESTWRKRPRRASRDGSLVAWRASRFELEAKGGADFGNCRESSDDRTCSFALLRCRYDPSMLLLVATTHLARNPECEQAVWPRSFQFGCLFRELLAFAKAHDAMDVPVVLTGDLNAKDCDVLSGIARSLSLLLSSPAHPVLWSVLDVPTPATTFTEARAVRIDYLLYQSALLDLESVDALPTLKAPIPNACHPSDHLPIGATFRLRPRSLGAPSPTGAVATATVSSEPTLLFARVLEKAFEAFDRDGDGAITPEELREGLEAAAAAPLEEGKLERLLRHLDANGDGRIDVHEFTSGWMVRQWRRLLEAADGERSTADQDSRSVDADSAAGLRESGDGVR